MKEVHNWAICDICGKRKDMGVLQESTPVGWFNVYIDGDERKPTPPNYPGVPRPETILVSVSTNSLCCSRKCVRACVKDLIK